MKFHLSIPEERGLPYVSPYNDEDVIAGQGTVGYELSQQLDHLHAVYVAVGGGGLISGIAGYLKHFEPGLEVIACLPENSPVMARCAEAGRIIDYPVLPTLSDGTAGQAARE